MLVWTWQKYLKYWMDCHEMLYQHPWCPDKESQWHLSFIFWTDSAQDELWSRWWSTYFSFNTTIRAKFHVVIVSMLIAHGCRHFFFHTCTEHTVHVWSEIEVDKLQSFSKLQCFQLEQFFSLPIRQLCYVYILIRMLSYFKCCREPIRVKYCYHLSLYSVSVFLEP